MPRLKKSLSPADIAYNEHLARANKAEELHNKGLSYRRIAVELGYKAGSVNSVKRLIAFSIAAREVTGRIIIGKKSLPKKFRPCKFCGGPVEKIKQYDMKLKGGKVMTVRKCETCGNLVFAGAIRDAK